MLSNLFWVKLKTTVKAFRRWAKRSWMTLAKKLPVPSTLNLPPDGYYPSSEDYWQVCQQWSSDSVTYTPVFPPSRSVRRPPQSLEKELHWKFAGGGDFSNPATFLICIGDGQVFGDAGAVITPDNRLLFDVSSQFGIGRDLNRAMEHSVFQQFRLPACQQEPGTVAVIATAGGNTFFHWLTDALPRIEIVRQAFPGGLGAIDKFLINSGIPVIVESLELLGIPHDKLIPCHSRLHIRASQLVVPSLVGGVGNLPPWACQFLRESFLPQAASLPRVPRLYISRSKARYRRVANELAVLNYLAKFGFESVCLEEYSFKEQIALLSQAEMVVAPHGAGLTNLIWCKPQTRVVEIFSPNYVNVCFWAMSNLMELDYCYLLGKGQRPPDQFDPHLHKEDITVCLDALDQLFRQLLLF